MVQSIKRPNGATLEDRPKVDTFSRTMIEQFLQKLKVKYFRDSDGDFVLLFAPEPESDVSTRVFLGAVGRDEDIYVVRVFADARIAPNKWGHAIQFCNAWNSAHRWPKAYLKVDDPVAEGSGEIILEEQLHLSMGIHQGLLEDFTKIVLAGSSLFWKCFAPIFKSES